MQDRDICLYTFVTIEVKMTTDAFGTEVCMFA